MGEEIDDELPDAQDVLRSAVATPRKRLAALERDVRPPKHWLAVDQREPMQRVVSRQRKRRLRCFFVPVGVVSTFIQKSAACAAPLVIIVAAWRLPAAVTLLRAEPATEFAALSHMLMNGLRLVHGFFIAHLSLWPPEGKHSTGVPEAYVWGNGRMFCRTGRQSKRSRRPSPTGTPAWSMDARLYTLLGRNAFAPPRQSVAFCPLTASLRGEPTCSRLPTCRS